MIKNPIYQFEDETSMGIDVVPDDVVVLIKDYDSTGPKQVLKVAHGGLTNLSTIEDFILTTGNWKEMGVGALPEQGGIKWDPLFNYEVGDTVTDDNMAYVCIIDHAATATLPIGNINWHPQVGTFDAIITKTVGPTGDFATYAEAFLWAEANRPKSLGELLIKLEFQAGQIWTEQITLLGRNLGHVEITSADVEVTIDATGWNTTDYNALVFLDSGSSLRIDILFDMAKTGGTGFHVRGGSGFISPNKGFKNAGSNGIVVIGGSCYAGNADISGAGSNGIVVVSGGCDANSADISGAGYDGIYIVGGSCHAYNADISGAGHNGIYIAGGSCHAYTANIGNAGNDGIHIVGGSCNAYNADISGAGHNGIYIAGGSCFAHTADIGNIVGSSTALHVIGGGNIYAENLVGTWRTCNVTPNIGTHIEGSITLS